MILLYLAIVKTVFSVQMAHNNPSLITTISYVGQMVEEELDKNLNSIGLSVTQLNALHHIQLNGGSIALSELADQKECVKSNITQLTDRMETKGLVERVRSDTDRRKILTVLTPKGKKLYHKGMKILASTENKILSRIPEEQKKKLAGLLNLIAEEES